MVNRGHTWLVQSRTLNLGEMTAANFACYACPLAPCVGKFKYVANLAPLGRNFMNVICVRDFDVKVKHEQHACSQGKMKVKRKTILNTVNVSSSILCI